MKKLLLSLIAFFALTISASAMSYEQARQQALFLTDKMAYELNLTEEQYRAAYEVNLDYLMNVNTVDDLYGAYWVHRNTDLSYILLDWQYRNFLDAAYFYRPLSWSAGYWHFGIYARYPRRDYLYFGRPVFYTSYRGGHSWRYNGGRSWYRGRIFVNRNYADNRHFGMRDGFHNRANRPVYVNNNTRSFDRRPDYQNNRQRVFGNMQRQNMPSNNRTYGSGQRESSTRTTVTRPNNGSFGRFGGSRSRENFNTNREPTRTFTPQNQPRQQMPTRSFGSREGFGGSRGGSFGGNVSRPAPQTRGSFGGSFNRGSFGGHR